MRAEVGAAAGRPHEQLDIRTTRGRIRVSMGNDMDRRRPAVLIVCFGRGDAASADARAFGAWEYVHGAYVWERAAGATADAGIFAVDRPIVTPVSILRGRSVGFPLRLRMAAGAHHATRP